MRKRVDVEQKLITVRGLRVVRIQRSWVKFFSMNQKFLKLKAVSSVVCQSSSLTPSMTLLGLFHLSLFFQKLVKNVKLPSRRPVVRFQIHKEEEIQAIMKAIKRKFSPSLLDFLFHLLVCPSSQHALLQQQCFFSFLQHH